MVSRRQKALLNPASVDEETPSPHIPAGPKKDYSLQEGQTFSISIPGKASSLTSNSSNLLERSGGSKLVGETGGTKRLIPLFPPPTSSKKRYFPYHNLVY